MYVGREESSSLQYSLFNAIVKFLGCSWNIWKEAHLRLQHNKPIMWKGTKLHFSKVKKLYLCIFKLVFLREKKRKKYLSISVNTGFLLLNGFWCCNILVFFLRDLFALFYTRQFCGMVLEMGFPLSHQNIILLSNVFLTSWFREKLHKFAHAVITTYISITLKYRCSCSRIKYFIWEEWNTYVATIVYINFLAYTAVTVLVDMPLPFSKMKSRWLTYMVVLMI